MKKQAAGSCVRKERSAIGFVASVSALLVMFATPSGMNLFAQTKDSPTKSTRHGESVTAGSGRQSPEMNADAAKATPTASETTAERPPASPDPNWPADQPPNPPTVTWDSRGLEIEASDSSLDQILRQVAAQTGARLEGRFTRDQRVFGRYGPGPGSEVLAKLLEGTGYNVLISGSRATGVPQEIVLSARSPIHEETAKNNLNRNYSEADRQVEPEQREEDSTEQAARQPNQDPFNIGGPPRDSVEFMQEILQRQNVIDQQQQQQQEQRNDRSQ